jgi:flagellar M-ring protein FliF
LDKFIESLQKFGIGRLAAIIGVSAAVAAALIALTFNLGKSPQALLYSNLDLKEASTITQALDQAGIKYEAKGDGSTIFVSRDKVGSTRMLLAGKGLPSSGSVGYEIFDETNALGQTDFVQNLNRQRALEGELARTIRSQDWVNFARVQLSMPKRELFEEAPQAPTAAVTIGVTGRTPNAEQVRALQNLVASAVPGLTPEKVTIVDQKGKLLGGGQDGDTLGAAGDERRTEVEESIRRKVRDLIEGVVGPGKVRVNVTADLDLSQVTVQEKRYDPDGQVVRSNQTSEENAQETDRGDGQVTVANNIPGGTQTQPVTDGPTSTSSKRDATTNYEISSLDTTTITAPGQIKRLSVAVAVDGSQAVGTDGKLGPYVPRNAEEMRRIEDLVRSAVGYSEPRGDKVTVYNVKFTRDDQDIKASSFLSGFDKNDLMRAAELGILAIVAALVIFFVIRPMILPPKSEQEALADETALLEGPDADPLEQLTYEEETLEGIPQLFDPDDLDRRINIARVEGQVKSSSIKRVVSFIEQHPDESIAILRSWLHEST